MASVRLNLAILLNYMVDVDNIVQISALLLVFLNIIAHMACLRSHLNSLHCLLRSIKILSFINVF